MYVSTYSAFIIVEILQSGKKITTKEYVSA